MGLLLHDYVPGLKFGAKIMNSEVMGSGLPYTFGNVFYVDATNGSDLNGGTTPDKAFATIAAAFTACTTNNNDVIVLTGNADHTITAMLDLSTKNRVHIIGTGNFGAFTEMSSKIVMGVTTATSDTSAVVLGGTRNTISNVKIISNNTISQCICALYAGGGGCVLNNVTVQNNVQLNQTGVYDVIFAGASNTYNNCEFGNDLVLRSVARHTALFGVTAAAPVKSSYFNNCTFKLASSSASSVHLQAGTGNCIQSLNVFRNTCFIADTSAGLANTVNVATNASVSGKMLFDQNTFTGVGTKMAASALNVGVWITAGVTPTAATSGVAILAA